MTEFRPTRFEILPPIIKNIIIINVLVFLAQNVLAKNIDLTELLALHSWQSEYFKPWQFLTHMFMHGDFMHLLFNMISLWFLGSILENLWGPQRFLRFYLICGLGAALLHLGIQYFQNAPIMDSYNSLTIAEREFYADKVKRLIDIPMVGASGAVSGCLAGLAYLMPNSQIFILPIPFPIKIKWYALFWFGKELISGLINSIGDNVAHFAHLGGGIVGFILVYFWNRSRKRFY